MTNPTANQIEKVMTDLLLAVSVRPELVMDDARLPDSTLAWMTDEDLEQPTGRFIAADITGIFFDCEVKTFRTREEAEAHVLAQARRIVREREEAIDQIAREEGGA